MRRSARRFVAVVRATVVESLGESFVFLTLLAALALTVFAPAIHFHQFGEAARLPRDVGFSAFLLGGSVAAVFGAIRSVRREVESGTGEAALAHAISPGRFLLAKTVGFFAVVIFFLAVLGSVTLVMVDGVEVGHALAVRQGGLARPWGPSLAIGVACLTLPVAAAAALNRFAGRRFTLTATLLTGGLAVLGAAVRWRTDLVVRYLPALLLAAIPVFFLTAVASVFAFRHRANVAATVTGLLAAASVPALGNYCLAEALSGGGRLAAGYLLFAAAAALPAFGALIALGAIESARQGDCS